MIRVEPDQRTQPYRGSVMSQGGKFLQTNTPAPAADLLIATHGDSISSLEVDYTYGWQLRSLILSTEGLIVRAKLRGIGGASWDFALNPPNGSYDTLINDAPRVVDFVQDAGIPNWLILFAGTNGVALGSHNAAVEFADFEVHVQARLAAGWVAARIIVCTGLPRLGFEGAVRQDYNDLLKGGVVTYGYVIADLAADPRIGDDGDQNDQTYYEDGLHPTAAGHAIIAEIIKDVIFP